VNLATLSLIQYFFYVFLFSFFFIRHFLGHLSSTYICLTDVLNSSS
jgi:hypothetical protein